MVPDRVGTDPLEGSMEGRDLVAAGRSAGGYHHEFPFFSIPRAGKEVVV